MRKCGKQRAWFCRSQTAQPLFEPGEQPALPARSAEGPVLLEPNCPGLPHELGQPSANLAGTAGCPFSSGPEEGPASLAQSSAPTLSCSQRVNRAATDISFHPTAAACIFLQKYHTYWHFQGLIFFFFILPFKNKLSYLVTCSMLENMGKFF